MKRCPSIYAGQAQSFYLDQAERLYVTGSNINGQLGLGNEVYNLAQFFDTIDHNVRIANSLLTQLLMIGDPLLR